MIDATDDPSQPSLLREGSFGSCENSSTPDEEKPWSPHDRKTEPPPGWEPDPHEWDAEIAEESICAVCGEPMKWAEPGQTTHPNCDQPEGGDDQ